MQQSGDQRAHGLYDSPCVTTTPLSPGWRNEFHAGFEQAFGRFLVIDAEYIWKYTHKAYDFSVLGEYADHFPDRMGPLEDSRIRDPRHRAELSWLHGFRGDVSRGRAILHAAGQRDRRCAQRESRYFESTTTRTSTKRPTCNTSRGNEVHGLASTGAMTAAWWPVQCLAPEAIARTARMAMIQP